MFILTSVDKDKRKWRKISRKESERVKSWRKQLRQFCGRNRRKWKRKKRVGSSDAKREWWFSWQCDSHERTRGRRGDGKKQRLRVRGRALEILVFLEVIRNSKKWGEKGGLERVIGDIERVTWLLIKIFLGTLFSIRAPTVRPCRMQSIF